MNSYDIWVNVDTAFFLPTYTGPAFLEAPNQETALRQFIQLYEPDTYGLQKIEIVIRDVKTNRIKVLTYDGQEKMYSSPATLLNTKRNKGMSCLGCKYEYDVGISCTDCMRRTREDKWSPVNPFTEDKVLGPDFEKLAGLDAPAIFTQGDAATTWLVKGHNEKGAVVLSFGPEASHDYQIDVGKHTPIEHAAQLAMKALASAR